MPPLALASPLKHVDPYRRYASTLLASLTLPWPKSRQTLHCHLPQATSWGCTDPQGWGPGAVWGGLWPAWPPSLQPRPVPRHCHLATARPRQAGPGFSFHTQERGGNLGVGVFILTNGSISSVGLKSRAETFSLCLPLSPGAGAGTASQ